MIVPLPGPTASLLQPPGWHNRGRPRHRAAGATWHKAALMWQVAPFVETAEDHSRVRLASLLAPDLEETLKSNPLHAAELAEELHAADLADVIEGLTDETAVAMLHALPPAVSA